MENVPDDLLMYSALVGFFLPNGIALVLQQGWSDSLKSVVGFCICLLAALGTARFAGNLDGQNFLTAALVVFTLATVSYRQLWRPTGIAPKLEESTSF